MHLPEQTLWHHVRTRFQQIWGYDDFRSPQGEIVRSLLSQRDALVVMPTGGGKSICFQLPALMRIGVTLVVSPLVALMENQVQELRQRQLPAALLHSEMPGYRRQQTFNDLQRQRLRLLYLSPETLLSESVWKILSQPQIKLNGLILDEAHCLVQWGETFRPAYQRLGAVRPALLQQRSTNAKLPIAAFTATADPCAQEVIRRVLRLQQPDVFLLSPYRDNLYLTVKMVWSPGGRRQALLRFIQQRADYTGLVYVRTRQDSEHLALWLTEQGYETTPYHAGLSPHERRHVEEAWINGKIKFVVCTSAFGMGINARSGVRWVFHFHAPTLLSEYVQEIGRAGRDGKPAEALMLISEPTGWLDSDDQQRQQFFKDKEAKQRQLARQIIRQIPAQGDIDTVSRQSHYGAIALSLLHSAGHLEWQDPFHYVITRSQVPQTSPLAKAAQQMSQYLKTRRCRWQFILTAFGFAQDAADLGAGCGHCDRCLSTH
jgi:ATP-dependent DNA helicase RecQ